MEQQKVKNIIESMLLAADKPLDVKFIETLFEPDSDRPGRDQIMQALQALMEDYQLRGTRLTEVASGYRMQVAEEYAPWVSRLWEEKPQRYSRALLETLVLIAYRQPITRGEIEEIRGVSVSTQTTKTLLERDWVRVLGHKDVPGKPAMYGTTRTFLDYFSLKTLDELPALSEIKDLDKLYPELALDNQVVVEDLLAADAPEATTDQNSDETLITGAEEQTVDEPAEADTLESER